MPAPWASGASVRIVGEIHGQVYNNVLNLATNTVINDPTALAQLLTELASAILQCCADNLLPAATSDFRLIGVEARQIHPTPGDPVFVPAIGNAIGQASATSVSFAATLVHVRTGQGGKSGRGRVFLPPPGEGEITASTIDAGHLTTFEAWVQCIVGKFIGAGATEDWRLGVLSTKKVDNVLPAYDTRFREAISMNVAPQMSVMSSRKVGRGV